MLFLKARNTAIESKIIKMMVMVMKYNAIDMGGKVTSHIHLQSVTKMNKWIQAMIVMVTTTILIQRVLYIRKGGLSQN